MLIVVESGATKTAWRAVCGDGVIRAIDTDGLNPTCLDAEQISSVIRKAAPVLNPEGRHIDDVFFYGAGLVSPEATAPLAQALEMWCPMASLHFHTDMLAAARALFGNGSGVVAIMVTGSNSCLYEDGQVIRNIRPGGYILGDEGSGAALGRAFLADFIKGLIPSDIEEKFIREYGLDYPQIVRKVYKEQSASAFMASLAPFILSNKTDSHVRVLIEDCLESFIRRSLARYYDDSDKKEETYKVGVVGSFGCACEDMLRTIGSRYGLEFVKFIKSPVDELVKYHTYGI
jgi:N-acetylglucosamine kinase-like BadF-type ATPase